jgi:chromosome segregation ATPase
MLSENLLIGLIGALCGLLGGLASHFVTALKHRGEQKIAAKQSDLDALRAIIDEHQEEIQRLKAERAEAWKKLEKEQAAYTKTAAQQEARILALEQDCETKNKLINSLEKKIAGLIEERDELRTQVTEMVDYIEILIGVMRAHNIPVPERTRSNSREKK